MGKSSVYKGVSLFKCTGKWRAQRSNGVTVVSLGDYDTEVDAARAYDIAELYFKRESPELNFNLEDYADDVQFILDQELVGDQLVQTLRNCARRGGELTSQYKGVSKVKQTTRWHAQINIKQKQKHLGFYANQEEAAEAYDRIAICKGYKDLLQVWKDQSTELTVEQLSSSGLQIKTNFGAERYSSEYQILAAVDPLELAQALQDQKKRPDLYALLKNGMMIELSALVFNAPFVIYPEHWENIPTLELLEHVKVLQQQTAKVNSTTVNSQKVIMRDLPKPPSMRKAHERDNNTVVTTSDVRQLLAQLPQLEQIPVPKPARPKKRRRRPFGSRAGKRGRIGDADKDDAGVEDGEGEDEFSEALPHLNGYNTIADTTADSFQCTTPMANMWGKDLPNGTEPFASPNMAGAAPVFGNQNFIQNMLASSIPSVEVLQEMAQSMGFQLSDLNSDPAFPGPPQALPGPPPEFAELNTPAYASNAMLQQRQPDGNIPIKLEDQDPPAPDSLPSTKDLQSGSRSHRKTRSRTNKLKFGRDKVVRSLRTFGASPSKGNTFCTPSPQVRPSRLRSCTNTPLICKPKAVEVTLATQSEPEHVVVQLKVRNTRASIPADTNSMGLQDLANAAVQFGDTLPQPCTPRNGQTGATLMSPCKTFTRAEGSIQTTASLLRSTQGGVPGLENTPLSKRRESCGVSSEATEPTPGAQLRKSRRTSVAFLRSPQSITPLSTTRVYGDQTGVRVCSQASAECGGRVNGFLEAKPTRLTTRFKRDANKAGSSSNQVFGKQQQGAVGFVRAQSASPSKNGAQVNRETPGLGRGGGDGYSIVQKRGLEQMFGGAPVNVRRTRQGLLESGSSKKRV